MDENPNTTQNTDNGPDHNDRRKQQPSDRGIVVNVEKAEIETVNADGQPRRRSHDWYDKTSLGILIATWIAATLAGGFTGWLAVRTQDIATDSANTYDATNRAYVAITGVKFDGVPEVGKNQRLKILYKNVGKEAASDFSIHAFVSNQYDFEPDSKGMPYVPPDKVQWPIIQDCSVFGPGEKLVGQRPVYPGATNETIAYAFNPGGSTPNAVFVPQRLLDGKTTFWIAGCAVYRSLNKPRHSPFCFYYQPAPGGDVKDGTFEWCYVGAGNAD